MKFSRQDPRSGTFIGWSSFLGSFLLMASLLRRGGWRLLLDGMRARPETRHFGLQRFHLREPLGLVLVQLRLEPELPSANVFGVPSALGLQSLQELCCERMAPGHFVGSQPPLIL